MTDIIKNVSKVADAYASKRGEASARRQDVSQLEVEEKPSVLDDIQVNQRINDTKKVQYVFIDDEKIKEVMASDRVKKREFLSKLSDSQRRRFLERSKKLADDAEPVATDEPKEISKLEYINLNNLITNVAFEPTKYNVEAAQDYCDEIGAGAEFRDLIQALADETATTEIVEKVVAILEEAGVETDLSEVATTVEPPAVEEQEDLSEIEETLTDSVNAAVVEFNKSLNFSKLSDAAEQIVADAALKGYSLSKVNEFVNKKINDSLSEFKAQQIRDDVVDKLADLPVLDDGKPVVEDEPKESVLETLESAIQKFIDGDSTALQTLAETSIDGEHIEEGEGSEPKPEEGENEDTSEDEDAIEEEDELTLTDSVKLAKHILAPKKETSKIVDKLHKVVPSLKKYDFKVSDCVYPQEQVSSIECVPEAPMTREEFYSLFTEPGYVGTMAQCGQPACLPVQQYEVCPGSNCILTNKDTIPQTWVPITGSAEEMAGSFQGLDAAGIAQEITDKCVIIDAYREMAAKTNNLALIDNSFYKKKLSDAVWVCDNMPAYLNTGIEGPCELYPSWCSIPVEVPCTQKLIYGTYYNVHQL